MTLVDAAVKKIGNTSQIQVIFCNRCRTIYWRPYVANEYDDCFVFKKHNGNE